MRSGQTRLVMAALALAVFWGLVYWSAPAARDGGVRMAAADEQQAAGEASPTERRPNAPREDRRMAAADPPGASRAGAELTPLTQRAVAPPRPQPAPEQAKTTAPGADPRGGVLAPQFREHVVRPGQTMLSIAKDQYGDSKRWEAISRANPRIDPLKLRAGTALRIPIDPKNVQGKALPKPETEGSGAAPAPSIKQYVVNDGDTLGAIAKRTLGSAGAWESILRANKGLLEEPEDLRPGMTLTIPATP